MTKELITIEDQDKAAELSFHDDGCLNIRVPDGQGAEVDFEIESSQAKKLYDQMTAYFNPEQKP